ncbi:MAG: hypothetical protein HC899_05490 [Leptolyngbyaceae cyanobacterium SM1_4_3]|nr:hypothetical protein [Leptolyngbyaceae cyanobacterium SM1_4_3]NJN89874.1 hypothetical protein [Leptolyngbyaceae cyanobacterium SL_5_14]
MAIVQFSQNEKGRSPFIPSSTVKATSLSWWRSPSSLSHYKLSELTFKEMLERSPLLFKSVGKGRSPH